LGFTKVFLFTHLFDEAGHCFVGGVRDFSGLPCGVGACDYKFCQFKFVELASGDDGFLVYDFDLAGEEGGEVSLVYIEVFCKVSCGDDSVK